MCNGVFQGKRLYYALFFCRHRSTNPRIGDILLIRAPYLKIYTEYISKFDKALKTLEEHTKKNPVFAQVLREFERQPKCANIPLAGYMLDVVQRITRYKLLVSGVGVSVCLCVHVSVSVCVCVDVVNIF